MTLPPKVLGAFNDAMARNSRDPREEPTIPALEAALEQYNKELLGDKGAIREAGLVETPTSSPGDFVEIGPDAAEEAIQAAINHVLREDRREACERRAADDVHRVEVEFDGDVLHTKLIHPEAGCQPGTDPDTGEECGEECWLTDWVAEHGTDLLFGKTTLAVDHASGTAIAPASTSAIPSPTRKELPMAEKLPRIRRAGTYVIRDASSPPTPVAGRTPPPGYRWPAPTQHDRELARKLLRLKGRTDG